MRRTSEYWLMGGSPKPDDLIAERARTVAEFRKLFRAYGLNVDTYSDDALAAVMLADREKEVSAPKRLRLAFARLSHHRL